MLVSQAMWVKVGKKGEIRGNKGKGSKREGIRGNRVGNGRETGGRMGVENGVEKMKKGADNAIIKLKKGVIWQNRMRWTKRWIKR